MKNKQYKVNTFGSNKSLIPIIEYINDKNCSFYSKRKLAKKINSIQTRMRIINNIFVVKDIEFLLLFKELLLLKIKEEMSNINIYSDKYPKVVTSHLKTFTKSIYSNKIDKINDFIDNINKEESRNIEQ